jgi:DNA topoisomerase I
MKAIERFSRPSPRYTEASLVKKLEELGIGRPSTYAPTISTILTRGYVEKRDKDAIKRAFRIMLLKEDKISKVTEQENTGAEKSKLFPTDLGLVVTDFLKQYFDDIMDYGFTARIENEFDEVAAGKLKWNSMIDDFYIPFKKDVDNTIETAERIKGERELGLDPQSGKKVVARMARFGPIVQIGDASEEEKPRFAGLRRGQSIETITYEEAMQLFELPKVLGELNGQEISVNLGRFGPYIKFGEQNISMPKGEDPFELTMERALEVIAEKQKSDAPIAEYDNKSVTKGTGRFGPFIKWNDLYINVPKRYDFENLTQADINELIEAKIKKEENRYIQHWPAEKISIENGRWGPYIKFQKKMLKLAKKADDTKYTAEELSTVPLEDVKKMIELHIPNAFAKKAAAKKAPGKKAAPKKAAPKKKSK